MQITTVSLYQSLSCQSDMVDCKIEMFCQLGFSFDPLMSCHPGLMYEIIYAFFYTDEIIYAE